MNGTVRGRYTLEFKQEAVRLVRGGQATSSVAKALGISGQTLHNWVKARAAGRLRVGNRRFPIQIHFRSDGEASSLKDSGTSCSCRLESGVVTCAKVVEVKAKKMAMIRNML